VKWSWVNEVVVAKLWGWIRNRLGDTSLITHMSYFLFSRAIGFGVGSSFGRLSHNRYNYSDKQSTVWAPKVASVVRAQNLFKRKGAKPILQVTVTVYLFKYIKIRNSIKGRGLQKFSGFRRYSHSYFGWEASSLPCKFSICWPNPNYEASTTPCTLLLCWLLRTNK
jgi:hypothetical protein